ncbi:MAG: histone H1 [Candidatus Muirbacterium halophilum]|nr:histone H1 [Candidatus Muirbacterium halophilum]
MEYIDKYDELLKLLTENEINGKKYSLKDDFEKFFIRGNKAAGKRIRKTMQEIKKITKEVRSDVQEYKSKLKN